ncbi:MAG TPA: B12-binding domain-containing radical SAM protein [Phycisphaerae bacterium]|jgi:radical SAM superfamily enzyme YgiQ (UPF0313 family)|nr:B12-binding domain-containing radical SAM protein [Phycisphaerae bacterium]
MHILLLYPEFPPTFWSFDHALKFIGKKAVSPPLGLLTVAAMLPREWDLRLVDMNVQRLRDKDLHWADYVFISAMAVQEPSVRKLIARCKAAGVPIVAGGPLFTSQPHAFDEVDHLVLNEAELTLEPFLKDLGAGRPQRVYTTTERVDLRLSPMPRFELANLRRYAIMPLQYSRGCPFDCEFCDVTTLFGHRPRLKTTAQVLRELDRLNELHWKGSVFFVDDNLIGNKRFLKAEFLPALADWQKHSGPIPFNSQASINLADDPELLGMLAHSGFSTMFIGIETPDSDTLLQCNKRQNTNRNLLDSVRRIQAAGIQVQGGFIIGFDHDAPSIFQKQIDFIQSSGIVTAMVGLLQALPGTRLHARLKVLNRLEPGSAGNNVAGSSNIVPLMDRSLLREGYFRVLRALYSPRGYHRRMRTFLRTYRRPQIRERLSTRYVTAFLRSTIVLGFLHRERFQYWYTLLWTLLRRPRSFPLAVQLSILGYHYRRICQSFC